jgi:hypothetical protein
MAGVRLDRYRWDKIQIGSGAPDSNTRGSIYLNSDNANLYVRRDPSVSWSLNASEGYGTLDDAYNDFGASPATTTIDNAEGQGDVTFSLSGALSFVIDASGATGAADGFSVVNGTDQFNLIRDAADQLSLDADLTTVDISASSTMTLSTTTSGNLFLSSAGELRFLDVNRTGSTWSQSYITLSDSTSDWDDYETLFGEVSIMDALSQAASVTASGWGGNLSTSNTTVQSTFDEIDRQYYLQEWTGAFGNSSIEVESGSRGSAQDIFSVSIYKHLVTSNGGTTGILTPTGEDATRLVLDTNAIYFVEGMILCAGGGGVEDPEDLYGNRFAKSWKVRYTVMNDYGYILLVGFDKEVVHTTGGVILDLLDITYEVDQLNKSLNLVANLDSGAGSNIQLTFQGGLRAQKLNNEDIPYSVPV